MKTRGLIIYYLNSVILYKTVLAQQHGSNCCSNWEELWVDHNGFNQCLNTKTNVTERITLNCFDNMTSTFSNDSLPYTLNNDGSLSILMGEMLEEIATIQRGEFCLGHETEDGKLSPVVLLCLYDMEAAAVSFEVLGYSMAVSSVFFALTAIVYLAFPELKDLEGRSIVCLCIAQAIAYGLMGDLTVMVYSEALDMTWCAIRGFLAYYFLESSFFWMNALAVQILITVKYSSTCNGAWKKFEWYALYAWGAPAILTLILIIVNYLPGSHKRPGIGRLGNCWFTDLQRVWYYLYSILTIIMAANLGIFVNISAFLWKYTFCSSRMRTLRYKCCVMLRLFIITGLPLIFEMIGSFTAPHSHMIWGILDAINCLSGIIVFLILVVFRRRVLKSLHSRNMLFCLSKVKLVAKFLEGGDDEAVIAAVDVPLGESANI